MRERTLEIFVGLFMLLGMMSLVILAFKVSGFTSYFSVKGYEVTAKFDNIGDLKPRAPVSIGGVRIGQVERIYLDPVTFKAVVILRINENQRAIPTDSIASILTEGLLGSNYISITPGFEQTVLKDGGVINETHPAIILENLIGQFLFNINKKK